MLILKKNSVFLAIILFFSSCASIVSKSNWPFNVDSSPEGARVTITNRRGVEVYKGKTPATMFLKSGAGFFTKESYVVSLSFDGYETKKINVECKLNGWYFGNIVFGGVIGMLIVDPATGAMYKLASEGISENLEKSASTSLHILDKNKIPESWKNLLIRIN